MIRNVSISLSSFCNLPVVMKTTWPFKSRDHPIFFRYYEMSSKFAPESLLALRQVVDEKLTTEDVEHILEALQISDKENIPKE